MTLTQLRTPILDGGLKSIHFFNGRLLSAEDLSQEQLAQRQARRQLGQASGEGVVYGLEVKETPGNSTASAPVVTVSAGLALNRLGQPLQLAAPIDVALVRPATTGLTAVTALFADCRPLQGGPYVAGKGVYLLTLQPASGTDGKAPVSGLGNLDAPCNARYQIDGVQFRLIQLPLTAAELADTAHLRNHVALRCLGALDNDVTDFFANPFGPPVTAYGLLDELRPDCLKDDEVPLALIYWTNTQGVEFIDHWAVRRKLTPRSADAAWGLITSDRRAAEAEALFLQFQAQLADLRAGVGNLSIVRATQLCEGLPPIGLVPISQSAQSRGFNLANFFQGLPCREPRFVEGAQVQAMVHTSLRYPPLILNRREAINLYTVRDNAQRVAANPAAPPQAYVIFTTGHGPDWAGSRYDLSHWNYGNFA